MNHPVADTSSPVHIPAVSIDDREPARPHSLPAAPSRTEHHERSGLLGSLQSLLHLIVIAIFIITFCVQPFRIPSESMEPTLLVGDFLLVNKQSAVADKSRGLLPSASIHRGDIIVFHDPVDASLHLIKRVIGIPGDHLRLHNGRVLIDGQPLTEPYAVYRPSPPDNFRDNFPRFHTADPEIDSHWWIRMRSLMDDGDLIIPAGNYFVLGDNRNDSDDSRYWGFVPRDEIVGKPLFVYFSLRQRGAGDGNGTNPLAEGALADTPDRAHRSGIDALLDFARWGRTFRIVH